MLAPAEAKKVLQSADLICSEESVRAALRRMANEISLKLHDQNPLVLSVMGGAVIFSGQLLTLLEFPLDFDYLQVSRYGNATTGGEIRWKVFPDNEIAGRVVLVLDDILDEGRTMAAIRDRILAAGAAKFMCAVFADKEIGRAKPLAADFVGVTVPDRYVFGFGMDVKGAWRNLPAIYAMKQG
jgi:hypoxanthine phosphoribosyltransferase